MTRERREERATESQAEGKSADWVPKHRVTVSSSCSVYGLRKPIAFLTNFMTYFMAV